MTTKQHRDRRTGEEEGEEELIIDLTGVPEEPELGDHVDVAWWLETPLADFSPAVLERARALPSDAVVAEEAGTWRVTSRSGRTYRVRAGADYVTCTCPHGRNAGAWATCHHAAAALLPPPELGGDPEE